MIREIQDPELGTIAIRRHPQARGIRFRMTPRGVLSASVPKRTPVTAIKLAIKASRRDLKKMLEQHRSTSLYRDGQAIGKSHTLQIHSSATQDDITVSLRDRVITVQKPENIDASDPVLQQRIQECVIKALRKESRVYLGYRLERLAKKHGYRYEKIRYAHTGTRWGSCSSTGTISLNIALMMLPLELIDYVLIHELCHTKEMNHSIAFWRLVREADLDYEIHRKALKSYNPSL